MLETLKDLATGAALVQELRRTREVLDVLAASMATIAEALLRAYPPSPEAGAHPQVEVTHVDAQDQVDLMEAELRFTQATGRPPSEEELLSEFDRLAELRLAQQARREGLAGPGGPLSS